MVRCADCGCLSATDPDTKELVEVDRLLRQKWQTIKNHKQVVQKTPVCCKRIIDFQEKLGNQPDDSLHEAAVVKLIHEDIGECAGFEPYRPGVSPMRILEMIDLRDTHRFQDEQAEKARRWQAEQADLADKRQNERDQSQRDWQDKRDQKEREEKRRDRRWQLLTTVITGLIAIIAAIAGVLASRFLP